jgi:hypothetical protein
VGLSPFPSDARFARFDASSQIMVGKKHLACFPSAKPVAKLPNFLLRAEPRQAEHGNVVTRLASFGHAGHDLPHEVGLQQKPLCKQGRNVSQDCRFAPTRVSSVDPGCRMLNPSFSAPVLTIQRFLVSMEGGCLAGL